MHPSCSAHRPRLTLPLEARMHTVLLRLCALILSQLPSRAFCQNKNQLFITFNLAYVGPDLPHTWAIDVLSSIRMGIEPTTALPPLRRLRQQEEWARARPPTTGDPAPRPSTLTVPTCRTANLPRLPACAALPRTYIRRNTIAEPIFFWRETMIAPHCPESCAARLPSRPRARSSIPCWGGWASSRKGAAAPRGARSS